MQIVTENNREISERLRRSLLAKGWNQADLVTSSGVDKSHVSRLMKGLRGESMRKETRERLARALDVPVAWLFAGIGPDPFGGDAQVVPLADEPRPSERYPSKRSAAAALKGIVDDEAIAAMLSEEHYGTEKDPGADFWFERGLWWNRKRKEAKIEAASDLDEPPPMTARPKKVKRS